MTDAPKVVADESKEIAATEAVIPEVVISAPAAVPEAQPEAAKP